MLLFVRKKYSDAIRAGLKTFEIRAGKRYSKVRPGDQLSINGQFRVEVRRVEAHGTLRALIDAFPALADDIAACYPDAPGPFFVFHFRPPPI
jgi:ASC-1-like (ASCH) protein